MRPWVKMIAIVTAMTAFELQTQTCTASLFELESPAVVLPMVKSNADCLRLTRALESTKGAFVGGMGLNGFTQLRYRGNPKSLNHFLGQLAGCQNLTIQISLQRPGHTDFLADLDWAMVHMAGESKVHVLINVASPNLQLESLNLPEIHTGDQGMQMGE
jgi:hypothetical protein